MYIKIALIKKVNGGIEKDKILLQEYEVFDFHTFSYCSVFYLIFKN